MNCRIIFLFIILVMIVLAGCEKAECKKAIDCQKAHFTGTCIDKKCDFEPVPDECGNLECEEGAGENKCTCLLDCGDCSGKKGYFTLTCIDDICVEKILNAKPITQTKELSFAGNKISATTTFNQPFNIRSDIWKIKFALSMLGKDVNNLKINRIELTGTTQDRRTVQLASKDINKYLWSQGSEISEDIIIDFPTAEKSGQLTGLKLKVFTEYTVASAGTSIEKTQALSLTYGALKFEWAKSETAVCPESCDDDNRGTKDICSEKTNFFCVHTPIPGKCGNFECESHENKCACPEDCGPCTGSLGAYLEQSCVGSRCKAQLKPGINVESKSLFDDRNLNVFHLQNNYNYNNPFNIREDYLEIEFSLFAIQEGVSDIKITEARLLEITQEIAHANIDETLSEVGDEETTLIEISDIGAPEQQKTITLKIWYEYKKNNETKRASFTKPLGKITLIGPDK